MNKKHLPLLSVGFVIIVGTGLFFFLRFDFHEPRITAIESNREGSSRADPEVTASENVMNGGEAVNPDASMQEVAESEIDAVIAKEKRLAKSLHPYPEAMSAWRKIIRDGIQREKAGIKPKLVSHRELATSPLSIEGPATPDSKIEAFIRSHPTPGAYVAAAGASRNPAWLTRGLEAFPKDPVLMKATAQFDWNYLRDPTALAAWMEAEPQSGWPHILEADSALGRNEPEKAYASLKEAFGKEVRFRDIAEIDEFLSEPDIGRIKLRFRDLGDDGTMLTIRMASEFREAAEKALANGKSSDSKYYTAAALALSDLLTGSSNTENASMAAINASKSLKLLGVDGAVPFLAGESFEDARLRYAEIITAGKASEAAASEYRATLTVEAQTDFDRLVRQHGSSEALKKIVKRQ